MSTMKPFVEEMCQYIAQTIPGNRFTFGTGSDNLLIGEIVPGTNGVFAVNSPTLPPDEYTAVEYYNLDFWAVNSNEAEGFEDLRIIYELLHRKVHYQTENFQIFFSHAIGQIDDLDRDGENRKTLRLGIRFITTNLIS